MRYRSVKLKETSYDKLLELQYVLFKTKKLQVNKSCLMDFLIEHFSKTIEKVKK